MDWLISKVPSSSDKSCVNSHYIRLTKDIELLERDVDGVLGEDPSPREFKAMV